MRQSIFAIMLFFASQVVLAKMTVLSPMKMVIRPGDRIEIKGFRGQVEYLANDNTQDLTVEVKEVVDDQWSYKDEWQFSMRKEGSTVLINVDGPISKQIWHEVLLSGQIPQHIIKIVGPSAPLMIHWNDGRIVVGQLNAELQITSIKGDVVISKGEGLAKIFNQSGSVSVRDRKGQVDISSYMAKTEVSNIEGQVTIENFTGESRVQNVSGNLNLVSYNGTSKVAEVKGKLEFKNGNSPIHIDKFEGELRGRSEQGPVYAEIRGEADVRMESAEGSIHLRMPASGAWVNVGTHEGSLLVPAFLKLTRSASQQIRSGRLRSGSNGGNVFVRTDTGDIRVK